MKKYDVFLSYASEDRDFAAELAAALRFRGVRVWYDAFELKIGDKLLESIERGLKDSGHGLLLISPYYLDKSWTGYEMDILVTQHIEEQKRLLPIWHGVTKQQVKERNRGLAGIVSLNSSVGLMHIVRAIVEQVSSGANTVAVAPDWELPAHRFLTGQAELAHTATGRVFTLWEAILVFSDVDYPLGIFGNLFTRADLLSHAATALYADSSRVCALIGIQKASQVWQICVAAGYDPGGEISGDDEPE